MLASRGKKVLFVSLVDTTFLGEILKVEVGYAPKASGLGFDVCNWTGLECLKEYIAFKSRMEWLADSFLKSNFIRYLLAQAPGLAEISVLGKITSGARAHGPELKYDHIVVDSFSSGHFIAMIKTPLALAQTSSSGPMHRESKDIHSILSDKKICSYLMISTFESYSIQEAEETLAGLKTLTGLTPTVIGNKKIELPKNEKLPFMETVIDQQNLYNEMLINKLQMQYYMPLYFLNARDLILEKESQWLIRA